MMIAVTAVIVAVCWILPTRAAQAGEPTVAFDWGTGFTVMSVDRNSQATGDPFVETITAPAFGLHVRFIGPHNDWLAVEPIDTWHYELGLLAYTAFHAGYAGIGADLLVGLRPEREIGVFAAMQIRGEYHSHTAPNAIGVLNALQWFAGVTIPVGSLMTEFAAALSLSLGDQALRYGARFRIGTPVHRLRIEFFHEYGRDHGTPLQAPGPFVFAAFEWTFAQVGS